MLGLCTPAKRVGMVYGSTGGPETVYACLPSRLELGQAGKQGGRRFRTV